MKMLFLNIECIVIVDSNDFLEFVTNICFVDHNKVLFEHAQQSECKLPAGSIVIDAGLVDLISAHVNQLIFEICNESLGGDSSSSWIAAISFSLDEAYADDHALVIVLVFEIIARDS